MEYSEIVTIGEDISYIVGIVGLCHGDEPVGRQVLTRLSERIKLKKGQLRLIYANLPAEAKNLRGVEANLNRIFPGREEGLLEERIAFQLQSVLVECNLVVDIHSTVEPQGTFVITTETRSLPEEKTPYNHLRAKICSATQLDHLARSTGLQRRVHMSTAVTRGSSLIEFVNLYGKGYAISIETGQHHDPMNEVVGWNAVLSVLQNYGVVEARGISRCSQQEKYLGHRFIPVPSPSFRPSPHLRNFALLPAGTGYGRDNSQEYTLDEDCYPILFSPKLTDGRVFLQGEKVE